LSPFAGLSTQGSFCQPRNHMRNRFYRPSTEHGNSPRTAPSRGRPYKSGTLRPNQLVLRGRGRARALMGAKNRLAPTKASDEERARGPARASNSRRIRCREAVDGTERVVLFESRDEGGESRL